MVTYLTLDSSAIVASLREHVVKYIDKQNGDVTDTLTDADMIGKLGWKPRVGIKEWIRRFARWYEELVNQL